MVKAVALADAYDRTVGVLSEREREIGHLWAAGMKANRIAELLGISKATVTTTINSVYHKLLIASRDELRMKFAQGPRPPARSPRSLTEVALYLAVADAERKSPEDGEHVQKSWRDRHNAPTRNRYGLFAASLFEYLGVLPAQDVLGG